LIAANLYQEIGLKIKNNDISYDEGRVFLTKFEKFAKTIRILMRNKKRNFTVPKHNYLLHKSIQKLPEANQA